jgi:hypothetical protein
MDYWGARGQISHVGYGRNFGSEATAPRNMPRQRALLAGGRQDSVTNGDKKIP